MKPTSYSRWEEAEEAPWELFTGIAPREGIRSELGFLEGPSDEEDPPFHKFIYVKKGKRAPHVMAHEIGHAVVGPAEYLIEGDFRTIYWNLERNPWEEDHFKDLVKLRRFYTRGAERSQVEFVVDLEKRAAEYIGSPLYPLTGYPKWVKEGLG